jgi:hypothetical protein
MALHVLTRDDSPYVPHSIATGIAVTAIATASCDAMTLSATWTRRPASCRYRATATAIAHPIARDRDRHSVPGRVVQGERGDGRR